MKRTIATAITLACLASLAGLAQERKEPVYPYGAVYFRKSNPPKEAWARDHQTAARIGHNTFQHRFIWAAVETSPGEYDWDDYDRMMDLAEENGIKVVVREISNGSPEWMYDAHPDARVVDEEGDQAYPRLDNATGTGVVQMCLDHDKILEAAEGFQVALAERYKDHPAAIGFNLWNEYHVPECFCPATEAKFREWLREKYSSIENLRKAWKRYGIADWENVHAPRVPAGFPSSVDWLNFQKDNMFRLLSRRAELFRRHGGDLPIHGHGGRGGMEFQRASRDDWRAAEDLDVTGYTWVASRTGNELWKQFQVVDYTRASARGKPFWHAEAQSGPLWMQPQVTGRPRTDGRISYADDVRQWNLVSMALGTGGIIDTRWRPLLDGPLFGAFGGLGMDGSVTPQAEMGGKIAKWANTHPDIWKSRPVKGEVGIVFAPESMVFDEILNGDSMSYSDAMRGAYQAFFDSNIQADFVHIDDLDAGDYPVVYLPYPIMLKSSTAKTLRAYVESGGNLVSEGAPAYWGDSASVGVVQPNLGLDSLFGAVESYVEFTPDLLDDLELTVRGRRIGGRFYLQEYTPKGGRVVGAYDNGHAAAVENKVGAGKTLLIGTFPGAGYFLHHGAETREFFADLLEWGGVEQKLRVSDPNVKARLHDGDGGVYLWVINPAKQTRNVEVTLPAAYRRVTELWQDSNKPAIDGATLSTSVGGQNVAVLKLD